MNQIHNCVAKPIEVKAIQYDSKNFLEVEKLIGRYANVTQGINYVKIKNGKQEVIAIIRDWIVIDRHGIFSKLTNAQFTEKYEMTPKEF